MATIPRSLPTTGLYTWNASKPCMPEAKSHMQRVIAAAPVGWRAALSNRLSPATLSALGGANDEPEWATAWDMLKAIAEQEDRYGLASLWNLDDAEICDMAKKLAAEAEELDALAVSQGAEEEDRVDSIRLLIRCSGITEDKPIDGLPAIARAKDAAWWRRRLRVHVARTVEAGAVDLGLVHRGTGGYVSQDGLRRRQAQVRRNAATLDKALFRNEAGQVYRLSELAALGTANPVIRGGELMTRIRGAEEYADARGHIGLFLTLTTPSRFHAMKLVGKHGAKPNPRYDGATPRDAQLWLRDKWARTRSALARKGIRIYGLRVAEPHHDGTPHWHMLVWCETERDARAIAERIGHYWLSDDGDEPGAQENRINIKRMTKGGAAGYVAKYIAKSVGHLALTDHMDVVDGQQITMDFAGTDTATQETSPGYRRVDAWAATWGIRQFQTIGMPSVTVWRELRRVSPDQLQLFAEEGDRATVHAHHACHRHGDIKADWCRFMEAMGGHSLRRDRWHLRTAHRTLEPGQSNHYGEELKVGRIVGLRAQQGRMAGRWLISRRIAWSPATASTPTAEGEPGAQRAALPRPWTGFTNCTARLSVALRRQLFGRGAHEIEDWTTPQSLAEAARQGATC